MRKMLIVLLGSVGLVAASAMWSAPPAAKGVKQASSSQASAATANNRFVGTWKLVTIERRDAKGALLPPQPPAFGSPNPIGFIIYDPAGYMGVTIMQSGRQKYAGAQPTPEEARAALTSYTSYFGTYTINEAERVVTHHVQGSLNPNMGTDQRRYFEFSGNRLTLKPPPGATGVQSRLTWERLSDLETLTPTHRRFIGFWKFVSNDRRKASGELVSSNPGQTGFIIYTSSGHMAVHMMRPGRTRYAGVQPTPEEARAALSTYTSYFGPYTIHEAERYVVHHRIGITNPGQIGTDAQRFYEFSGKRLILQPPPTKVDGQEVRSFITWEHISESGGSDR